MARLAIYDSESVALIIGGIIISDLTDDPFVTVTKRNDTFADDEGSDGGVIRHNTHSRTYDITVSLLGGSADNQVLAALAVVDATSTNGAGVVPFLLKDNNGATLYTTDSCWIKKPADAVFGMNRPAVAWELSAVIDPANAITGGNG